MNDLISITAEEREWHRNPITSDETAGLRLAAAVIINAIEEYRSLSGLGFIVDGRVPPECLMSLNDRRFRQPWMKYLYEWEVVELIDFFHSDKLQRWLDYAHFRVTAAVIRERLGIRL